MRHLLLSLMPCLLCAQIPQEPAHVQLFQATSAAVRKGGTVTLRWAVTGVDRVRLEPLGMDLPARGEITQPVNGRTIFWLHASNLKGGQSVPLVVDQLPDDPAFPNLNGLQLPAPAAPPAVPVLAPAPAVAAQPAPPQAPVLVLEPAPAVAAQTRRRRVRRAAPRPAWIQFSAMVNPRLIRKLQKHLARVAATEANVWAVARRAGAPMQLLRSGPYVTVQDARRRLQELGPVMASMHLRPFVISGPDRSNAGANVFVASVRKTP